MGKPKVYLAGGIAGLSGSQAAIWRIDAELDLNDAGIEALDPMRHKRGLAVASRISTDYRDYADLGPFFTSRGIMARDYNDVKRCDALLVNLLRLERPSIGTIMELAWAYALQKPAVVVMERDGNPHDGHPMLHEAVPFRVETLEDGIDAVIAVLNR